MNSTRMLRVAALLGGLAVTAGALGAHALEDHLGASELETFQTAVRYQIYHALALMMCALLARHHVRVGLTAHCFLWGTVMFSGSLYVLTLTEAPRWVGPITPLGGLLMLVGWGTLALRSFSGKESRDSG